MFNDFTRELLYENNKSIITVRIKYENRRLSISSYGKEKINGRWHESSSGQAYEELLSYHPESYELVELWLRWHLNDMNAGDKLQEGFLRASGGRKSYKENCTLLKNAGILTHDGYRYGTAWKLERVPLDVLHKLKNNTFNS